MSVGSKYVVNLQKKILPSKKKLLCTVWRVQVKVSTILTNPGFWFHPVIKSLCVPGRPLKDPLQLTTGVIFSYLFLICATQFPFLSFRKQ